MNIHELYMNGGGGGGGGGLMLGPTHQKLKFLVVKIWCYQLKEFVLTKPKLF